MKLREWIYQATTQVNVLSPEMSYVVEVDTFHAEGRQHHRARQGKGLWLYRGLRQLHGIRWMIRELGRSIGFLPPSLKLWRTSEWYTKTSSEKQGLVKDPMEVGLTGSTPRTGKPATRQQLLYERWLLRGSGQQRCDSARYNADTQKSGRHHG